MSTELANKVTVVTEPNLYYMEQPTFLLVGGEMHTQSACEFLSHYKDDVTVYIANQDNDIRWLMNCYNQAQIVLLDADYNDFLTGLLIDKPKTHYYNSERDLSTVNMQQINDPADFLIKWVDNKQ